MGKKGKGNKKSEQIVETAPEESVQDKNLDATSVSQKSGKKHSKRSSVRQDMAAESSHDEDMKSQCSAKTEKT